MVRGLFRKRKPVLTIDGPDEFEVLVEDSDLPVLVDFHADWSQPCRVMSSIVKELADELDGQAVMTAVDIDEHPDIARRLGIKSVPTVMVYRDGKPKGRYHGVTDKATLVRALTKPDKGSKKGKKRGQGGNGGSGA